MFNKIIISELNFLGHIYLSGSDEDIIIGNFIADFTKGNDFTAFSKSIHKGILLHRKIDTFTDNNIHFLSSAKRLSAVYGRYSKVATDIVFDHFLAKNWAEFHPVEYRVFVDKIHFLLSNRSLEFPDRIKDIIPRFISQKWFLEYPSLEGIQKVLERMAFRTSLPEFSKQCIGIVKSDYNAFEREFFLFIKEASLFFARKEVNEIALP